MPEEWNAKWGWSDQRNHETWWLLDTMPTDWIRIEDYHVWVDFHMSARLVIFHEKKIAKELQEFYDYEDRMGMWVEKNY